MKSKKVASTKAPLKTKSRSDAFDRHIGQKLKSVRAVKEVTQEELATALGITFQQVQKYEMGANRISATRLYAIAKILEVNVSDFYEGYEEETSVSSFLTDIEKDKELAALLRGWKGIKNKELKKTVLKLFRTMVESQGD